MPLTIRPVTTAAECVQLDRLIMAIWQRGEQETISTTMLVSLLHNGAVMLLAWDGDTPVGFTFSFVALTGDQRLKHHSQMAGVLPAYQNQHVGERLKWAQRAHVLARGIDLITWTYDPLQSRNARLNLHRLGALGTSYLRDFFGVLHDGLNAGMPTDRVEVAWHLASVRVERRAQRVTPHPDSEAGEIPGVPVVNLPIERTPHVHPGPISTAALASERWLVAVPRDYPAILRSDPALALAWRLHIRGLFEQAFADNYAATDLHILPTHCVYLLERETLTNS